MYRQVAWATLATLAGGLLAPVAFAQSPTDIGTLPGLHRQPAQEHRQRAGDRRPSRTAGPGRAGHLVDPDPRRLLRRGPAPPRRPAPRRRPRLRAAGRSGRLLLPARRRRLSLPRRGLARGPRGTACRRGPRAPPGFTDALALDANHHGLVVGEATNPRETINGSTVRHAVAWIPKQGVRLRGPGSRRARGLRREQRLRGQRARGGRRHGPTARERRRRRPLPEGHASSSGAPTSGVTVAATPTPSSSRRARTCRAIRIPRSTPSASWSPRRSV